MFDTGDYARTNSAPEAILRILVAHNVPRVRTGGMSRLMGFIHDYVGSAGHEVDYFCSENMPASLSSRWKRLLFPIYICRQARAAVVKGEPYNIINVHEPSSAAAAMWRSRLGNPVVIVTSHGLEKRAWELSLEERRLNREGPARSSYFSWPLIGRWQCDLGLRKADHIFCLNSEDQDYLSRQMQIPPERITRIYPGASPIFAESSRGRDYTRSNRLLFAGSWRKNKGIEDMIPAFTELAQRHEDLTITVLEYGHSLDSVRSNFPADVASRVQVASTTSEAATAAVYANTDIFVLPSLFEGTPLTLIEAMRSGMPIVTTATCGMKDVVQHEENGLLIPLRSPAAIVAAVERLRADRSLRERLGNAAARKAASKYSWPQVARPVLEVYEALAKKSCCGTTGNSLPSSAAAIRST